MEPPDLIKAFTPNAVFTHGQERLHITRMEAIGELVLPSGAIQVCDPSIPDAEGLNTNVKPGRYEVWLSYVLLDKETDEIPGFCQVRFSDQKIRSYKLALRPDERLDELKEGEIYGFGVDTGLACFVDQNVAYMLEQEEVAKKLYRASDEGLHELVLDATTGANAIFTQAGQGDGSYCSWWALSGDKQPVTLTMDFGFLTRTEYDLITIDQPYLLFNEPLEVEDVDDGGLIISFQEWIIQVGKTTKKGIQMVIQGESSSEVLAECIDENGVNSFECHGYPRITEGLPSVIMRMSCDANAIKNCRIRLRIYPRTVYMK